MWHSLLASSGILLCLLGSANAEEHTLADGQVVNFPLFSNIQDDYSNALKRWKDIGFPESSLSPDVDWMPSFEAAIEKATREDKPILMCFFVRENGDPSCDV